LIAQYDIHPSTVKMHPSSALGEDVLKKFSEIYPLPNMPNLDILKNFSLEYVPFFDYEALPALSHIMNDNASSKRFSLKFAVDDIIPEQGDIRFGGVFDIVFENIADLRDLRVDRRYVMGSLDLNVYLYMDYGDFSSIVCASSILKEVGLSRDLNRLTSMKDILVKSGDIQYAQYYLPIVDLAISQYE
jgi:hypothetical protein